MKRAKALLLGVVVAVLLSACDFSVYGLPLPGGPDTGENPISIKVEFADVLDLVPQSTVKVNDVSVGKVTAIDLEGYQALVTIELRRDVELPGNAVAELRQTSLLGEKFVELSAPEQGAIADPLEDGETIPIERAGRNPEVEEVLGALSLLLNGGGVAQLKTITQELNLALEGREESARSVLRQLRVFMGQLDENKADIVAAIESLNRLAIAAEKQLPTIDAALDELPSALESIDRQRDDLVEMLASLDDLSSVAVDVIRRSKDATITSLQRLDPVLSQLAASGDNFTNAFHVFLTYPFVDEVVGRDPQVARNLHMGDYTNLSITLDVDLSGDPDDTPHRAADRGVHPAGPAPAGRPAARLQPAVPGRARRDQRLPRRPAGVMPPRAWHCPPRSSPWCATSSPSPGCAARAAAPPPRCRRPACRRPRCRRCPRSRCPRCSGRRRTPRRHPIHGEVPRWASSPSSTTRPSSACSFPGW